MLSTQQHYDWGLRALKTVLKGCGDVIRFERQKQRQPSANNGETSPLSAISENKEYEVGFLRSFLRPKF